MSIGCGTEAFEDILVGHWLHQETEVLAMVQEFGSSDSFGHVFMQSSILSGVRASITIKHIRKSSKMNKNIARFKFFKK